MPVLDYIRPLGFRGDVPLSLAVRAGPLLFVSGIPAYDACGNVAVNDFRAQMKQVMDNITSILGEAGAGWDCVVKTNILLTRRDDFVQMDAIYASYFRDGSYPARTTAIVLALPRPDFLLEIECQAVIASG
jgi:2-iminobutanoate/2-iminopropanoate deaminase